MGCVWDVGAHPGGHVTGPEPYSAEMEEKAPEELEGSGQFLLPALSPRGLWGRHGNAVRFGKVRLWDCSMWFSPWRLRCPE